MAVKPFKKCGTDITLKNLTGTRLWQHILVLASITLPWIDYAWRWQDQHGIINQTTKRDIHIIKLEPHKAKQPKEREREKQA